MLSPSLPQPAPAATFYTVSTHRFFLGTVALLNSLRLTGNTGQLVVLDAGLTSDERELLEAHATVFSPPGGTPIHPVVMKTYAHLSQPSGTVVVIDSDMVVTGSLDHIVALAAEGQICAYPDTPEVRGRWFREWERTLELASPVRPDVYVNSGLVAFSTAAWPDLLERWRAACESIPPSEMWGSHSPFNAPDQDALNALLMSEIPREALALLPNSEAAFGGDVKVLDYDLLKCAVAGHPVKILHLLDSPKPWEPSGWLRLAGTDYARLMRRLLFASDVPLRLDPSHVPLWLQPSRRGELALRILGSLNRAVVRTAYKLPEALRTRLRQARRWFAYGRSHGREVKVVLPPLDYVADGVLLAEPALMGLSESFPITVVGVMVATALAPRAARRRSPFSSRFDRVPCLAPENGSRNGSRRFGSELPCGVTIGCRTGLSHSRRSTGLASSSAGGKFVG
jgi:hypothetical protein